MLLATVAALALTVLAPVSLSAHTSDPLPPTSGDNDLVVLGQYIVDVPGLTSDVWALGNYAYLGSFSEPFCSQDLTGVRIIDISDPANPFLAAFIKDKPGTRTNDVKVAHIETSRWTGDILVTTNEACGLNRPRLNAPGDVFPPFDASDLRAFNSSFARSAQGGINIYDVTDPTNPKVLKQNFLSKANGIHNTYIWEQGESAYLIAVDDVDLRDVIVVDITFPRSPREIARVGAPDWPDTIATEVQGATVFLHDVWVQQNGEEIIAYLSYWDAGLVLLDVADPANPVFLGDSTYPIPDLSGLPPEGNGHVAVPNGDGSLVIFGDEDTSKFSTFIDLTIDAVITPVLKVGVPDFGPLASVSFPTPVVSVADNLGCNTGDYDTAGGPNEVVLIERGDCFFSTKAANAEAAGYDGYIVFNSVAGGDGLIDMSAGTNDVITVPGLFVGRTVGTDMAAAIGSSKTVTVNTVAAIEDGEGFMRVIDVTDTGNMVQIGTYVTERTLPPANALASGTRDAHNVVVDGDLAYWAWYYEGIRVVNFSDCDAGDGFDGCTPTEIAHWDGGEDPDDIFWGVYVHQIPGGEKVVLGSARDSGLWIFEVPTP